jgi:hypothetical protein
MKVLWSLFPLIPPTLSFAAQELPSPLLGPLADRILFLFALWVLIVALLITLRWKISVADALFRMMPQAKSPGSKEAKDECSRQGVSPRTLEDKLGNTQNPAL